MDEGVRKALTLLAMFDQVSLPYEPEGLKDPDVLNTFGKRFPSEAVKAQVVSGKVGDKP
jgi:hypothetical protein